MGKIFKCKRKAKNLNEKEKEIILMFKNNFNFQ